MKLLLENWRKYLDEAPKAIEAIPGTGTQAGRQGTIDYFWDGGKENLKDEKDPATGWSRFIKINRKEGGKWKGYQVVLFNDATGRDTFYFLLDGETPIFYIATQPHKDGVITGNVRKSGGEDFKAAEAHEAHDCEYVASDGTFVCDVCGKECHYCAIKWLPQHKASFGCRSGGYNHCTCGTCF